MKKADAHAEIIRRYEPWKATQTGLPDNAYFRAQEYFAFIEKTAPHLLNFRSASDPWQDFQGWIKRHEGYGRI